jgi:hypothetical protein
MRKMRPTLQNRILRAALYYLSLYALASYLDMWTTHLALTTSGTHEGNAFVTSAQVYLTTRAWITTVVGGAIMVGCVVFAAAYAERMDGQWLLSPVSSFKKMHLNPWSKAAMTVSPLHALSLALGFALLRILAAANNTLIYFYGFAPIGGLIELIAKRTSEVVAFAIVIVPLFYLLAIAVSPLAAAIVAAWRTSSADAVSF